MTDFKADIKADVISAESYVTRKGKRKVRVDIWKDDNAPSTTISMPVQQAFNLALELLESVDGLLVPSSVLDR